MKAVIEVSVFNVNSDQLRQKLTSIDVQRQLMWLATGMKEIEVTASSFDGTVASLHQVVLSARKNNI